MAGRNRRRRCWRVWIFLAVLFAFFSFPIPGGAQLGGQPEKRNFTISYTQASGAFTTLWVAQEAGLFKKHGLEATLKVLNSQVAAQALVAGEVDVISTGPDLVNMRLQGARVNYIEATFQRLRFQRWEAKGLTWPAGLRARTIPRTR